VVSALPIKIVAAAAALITGILGGAYVAGIASGPHAQTPVVGSTTPSRVASPSAPVAHMLVSHTSTSKHEDPPKHAKHHAHSNHND